VLCILVTHQYPERAANLLLEFQRGRSSVPEALLLLAGLLLPAGRFGCGCRPSLGEKDFGWIVGSHSERRLRSSIDWSVQTGHGE
jgi:hypothetical protein